MTFDDGLVTGWNWKRALGCIGVGVVLVGLAVFLFVVGLDDADKWASVLGVFVGLVGLAVSVYGVVSSRPTSPTAGAQRVERLDAGKGVDVVDGVRGSLRLGTPPSGAAPPPVVPSASPNPVVPGEQSVSDVQAKGAIRVIRGVDGNVDIGP